MLEQSILNERFILASNSPRRRELLTQGGFVFEVITSDCDETCQEADPACYVEELSFRKAQAVLESVDECNNATSKYDFLVIGADTVVSYGGEILLKPTSKEEAFDMLGLLSNRTHQVYTGVTILAKRNENITRKTFSVCTDVTFYEMNPIEMKKYIETGDPLDKAGAYGIQGPCAIHIKEIVGDYNNVVGLPLSRLYQEVKDLIF